MNEHERIRTAPAGWKRPSRLVLAACVALLAAAAAPAQETLSSIQRELDRVEREIAREQELHKQERARAAEFERQKNERLRALNDQLDAADARIDSLTGRMETERRRRAAQRALTAQYLERQRAFRGDLADEIASIISRLERDFPYQRERRVSEWRELAEANREATAPVEEILLRMFSLMQASLDFAHNSEGYPGTYTTAGGDTHEGFYVRLGAVAMVFSSSDGQQQAFLAKTPDGYVWRDDGLTSETRTAIRSAVNVAQGREAPRLVPLPVEVSAASTASMNGGAE